MKETPLKELERFYTSESPEELRLSEDGAQYLEFLTASDYLSRYLPKSSAVLDSCAGTGVYAFYLAGLGHRVTAGDIVVANVDKMCEKQRETPLLEGIYQGDALDLSRFPDGRFDAVLLMGALYHLQAPDERRRAIEEGLRVLREGGILVCTYMNRYGVILNDSEGGLENLDDILRFLETGSEGVFYASTPEEMRELVRGCGAVVLAHAALDGMSVFLHRTAGLLNERGFLRWREYHALTREVPSLLGSSYHNLLIVRKEAASI